MICPQFIVSVDSIPNDGFAIASPRSLESRENNKKSIASMSHEDVHHEH